MNSLGQDLVEFYQQLSAPTVPKNISVLHPHPDEQVMTIVKKFFTKFYNDHNPRKLLLGINPGRFGAGITGINFTAPLQLKEKCGIDHPWKDSSELSAEFIYDMIGDYGGPQKFYGDYFIGAVCPLGFMKDGKNINYYDEKDLQSSVTGFIISSIRQQIKLGFKTETCFCIGGEKNYKFLASLNAQHHFFEKIVPLAHPRFIMQYRRKKKQEYINEWIHLLQR